MKDETLAELPAAEMVHSGTVEIATTDNPYLGYLASLSRGSIATQRSSLGVMLREALGWDGAPEAYPWHELRYLHTSALRTWLSERYAPTTATRVLCALRGVLRQAYRLELMTEREYRLAVDIDPIGGTRLPAGRHVTRAELRALFEAAQATAIGARDAAILATLYGSGMRRAELVSLDLEDVDLDARSFRVRGKGNRERIAYVPQGTIAALENYLAHRGRDVECEPALFWPTVSRACRLTPRRISVGVVASTLARLARGASVSHLSPHDLRRTFVGDMLDAGADLNVVSQLAGHASVTTTARYDRRGERARAAAVELIDVPFSP